MFHSEQFWRLFAWTSMATSVSGASSKTVWRHAIGWRHDSRTCSTRTSYFCAVFSCSFLPKEFICFVFTTWLCEQHSHIVWMVPCQVNRCFIIQYITRQNHIYPTPTNIVKPLIYMPAWNHQKCLEKPDCVRIYVQLFWKTPRTAPTRQSFAIRFNIKWITQLLN